MLVILDANSLDQDRDLRGKWTRALLAASRSGELRIAIPEVVIRELVQHQRLALAKAASSVRSGLKLLNPYVTSVPSVNLPETDELESIYDDWLRTQLDESDCMISPIPSVNHEELLDRAVEKRHPFRGHDEGYRDTLIWFTTIELAASETEPVILCSANSNDFWSHGASPPTLHDELAADLRDRGLGEFSVRPMASIEAVVRAFVTEDPVSYLAVAELKGKSEIIRELIFGDDRLESLIRESLNEVTVDIMSPAQPVFVEPRGPVSVEDVDVEDVQLGSNGSVLADLKAFAQVEVAYGLSHTDEYGHPHSWQGAQSVSLEVPAEAAIDSQEPRLLWIKVDDEVPWGVVEDYEPVS
jgi:hypothetical protein